MKATHFVAEATCDRERVKGERLHSSERTELQGTSLTFVEEEGGGSGCQ